MAFKVLVHYLNQTDCVYYDNVGNYAQTNGVLSLTVANVAPATGTTVVPINLSQGVTRVEIFPQVTNFPGNTAGTPSG